MDTQPKALVLAEYCEDLADEIDHTHLTHDLRAAADELRRLHDENRLLHERHHGSNVEYTRVLAQRNALLEALRALVQNEGLEPYSYLDKGIGTATAAGQRWLVARAVIAAAKG